MRITHVYTRFGDGGNTQIGGGAVVSKASLRVEAIGTVDELNAFVGVVRSFLRDEALNRRLEALQHELFTVGADLAVPLPAEAPRITDAHVKRLEEEIDQWNAHLPPLKEFILPAGSPALVFLHVCRTVCRRLERVVVRLAGEEQLSSHLLPYINRLSDWFFVLARMVGHLEQQEETYARFSRRFRTPG